MQLRALKILVVWFLLGFTCCSAQSVLVLDVTKLTGFKRIKYYPGDEISFKDGSTNTRYKGTIISIRDSSIVFANREVDLKDIKVIYRDNANFVTRGLSRFCLAFGIMFVGLDTFNNITNKRKPAVNETAVEEAAAFEGAGLVLKYMMKHRYKTGKRRTLKVIDLRPV